MYMYVNKRVDLAQRGIALYNFILFYFNAVVTTTHQNGPHGLTLERHAETSDTPATLPPSFYPFLTVIVSTPLFLTASSLPRRFSLLIVSTLLFLAANRLPRRFSLLIVSTPPFLTADRLYPAVSHC